MYACVYTYTCTCANTIRRVFANVNDADLRVCGYVDMKLWSVLCVWMRACMRTYMHVNSVLAPCQVNDGHVCCVV